MSKVKATGTALPLTGLHKKLSAEPNLAFRRECVEKYCRKGLPSQIKRFVKKNPGIVPDITLDCEPEIAEIIQLEVDRLAKRPVKEARIYKYGCIPPDDENRKKFKDQLFLRNRYRNSLVEIERKRRDRNEKLVNEHAPELAQLEQEWKQAQQALIQAEDKAKSLNIENCSKKQSPEMKAVLTSLRKSFKVALSKYKEYKSSIYKKIQDTILYISDKEADEAKLAARSEFKDKPKSPGLFWGSYLDVEVAMKGVRSGKPPRFKRFTGNGKIVVQLQNGLSIDNFFAGKSRYVKASSVDGRLYVLKIQVGSDDKGDPSYAEIKFVYHRPLPTNTEIKWCWVTCNHIATHEKWEVQFVLEGGNGDFINKADGKLVIGMDVGWRIVPDGLRVCAYGESLDDEGQFLIIPNKLLQRWKKTQELQSIRDNNHNKFKAGFIEWLSTASLPDWMKEDVKFISKWKGISRLAKLVTKWRHNRFVGDEEMFLVMNAWRKQDRHLYDWQENNRRKSIGHREHIYRNFAKELSKRYSTVKMENVDWSKLQKNKVVEKQSKDDDAIDKNRAVASVGLLKRIISEYMKVIEVEAAGTTAIHWKCGKQSGQKDKSALIHYCEHCDDWFDRDENGWKRILTSAPASK